MAKVNRYDVKRNVSKKDIVFGSDSERNLASTNFEVGDISTFVKNDISTDLDKNFLSKESYNWVEENLTGSEISVSASKRNISIVGGSSSANGVLNGLFGIIIKDDFPDGLEVCIRNSRLQPITIVNNYSLSTSPLSLYTDKDYLLAPLEVITFKYVKKDNNFVSVGVLGISKNDIDDILGGDDKYTLFIDSSMGDVIDANNMQTTLTAYVDEYFKDITHEVTQWQWFRESGKTQEDINSDNIWSVGKTNRVIYLKAADFTHNIYESPITFTCQATINNKKLKATATIG